MTPMQMIEIMRGNLMEDIDLIVPDQDKAAGLKKVVWETVNNIAREAYFDGWESRKNHEALMNKYKEE